MRAVVQRVESSEVYIDGNQFAAISKGLLIFLGIEKGDMEIDAENLLDKIIYLRIFEDGNCKMNLSLLDVSGDLMVVSQFTLLADCRKGRRPAFTNAAKPEDALKLYNYFSSIALQKIPRVMTGKFQAMMKIRLVNDGPVTIILDSKKGI